MISPILTHYLIGSTGGLMTGFALVIFANRYKKTEGDERFAIPIISTYIGACVGLLSGIATTCQQ